MRTLNIKAAFLLFPLLVSANPTFTSVCVKVAQDLIQQWTEGVLLPADRQKIEQIYGDSSIDPTMKAEKVFEVFIERRLSLLPPSEAEDIRRIIAARTLKLMEDEPRGGTLPSNRLSNYDPRIRQVTL